ncbi:MAG: hypothetical protein PHQ60_07480 [Sideroxydans sp.]|nr:hypothetical protein [Sideroxydans sp.]
MNNFRMMSAMVLFRLEQALGSVVQSRNPNIDDHIRDIADSIIQRESLKRPGLVVNSMGDLVAETYIEDLFQLALRIAENTSDYPQWLLLKNLCSALGLYEIRNAIAHPNRPFPDCYWYRMGAIASDPLIQQLGLVEILNSFDAALAGKLSIPPEEWINLPEWLVPNNLPSTNDFVITGLIGRPKESKDLHAFLVNQRINCISIVAPGGVGKTALAIDVLDKACKSPEFHKLFEAVIFLSLKLEKLTATGVVKLDAPSTITEVEYQLAKMIPRVIDCDDGELTFAEVLDEFADRRLLLFIDNLETLLRDNPEEFEVFQMSLPVNWRILTTSRVNTNSATCLPIGPLQEATAKHLARIYATRRNATALVEDNAVERIVCRSHCNPLAIRLGIDSYMLGKPLDDSINLAASEVLNFSYKNLMEVLSPESISILECLFLQDSQTRIELAENIGTTIDVIASGLFELSKTSLITRDSGKQQERHSLYPSVRDLLLAHPRDAQLRSAIQVRILQQRDSINNADQRQRNMSRHHEDYVAVDLPEVVRNVLFETVRITHQLGKRATSEDALQILSRLRELKDEYATVSAISRHIAKISERLGDSSSAVTELKRAIEISPQDVQALKMLGRLALKLHDYQLSYDCYLMLKELGGWDPSFTDVENMRYHCNGYLIAMLYLGWYDKILDETQDWAGNEFLKDILGAFRARAWKRSIENEQDLLKRCFSLNKSAVILKDLLNHYGYPELFRGVFKEVIEEIAYTSVIQTFAEQKQARQLLEFVDQTINQVFKDDADGNESILSFAKKLCRVPLKDNPFQNVVWQEYLKSRGGQIYVDADKKLSLKDAGYKFVIVYHIPKAQSPFVFAKDATDGQYFVHFSCLSEGTWTDWLNIREGVELAVQVESNANSNKAVPATEVIIL